ncbi:MAG: pyridoxamine 5'-phosphate oxidase [Candidatus Velthaea sp.]
MNESQSGSDLSGLRISYEKGELDLTTIASDPFAQFGRWFEDALGAGLVEPNAMTVATVGSDGQPSARIVLLRGWDERGFVFFTNYESQKGHEIAATPRAALLFYWGPLERQIRIEGPVERLEAADSDAYFAKRPRGHRLSAWASRQSSTVADRAQLEDQMRAYDERFADADVPRPPYWGGYRVCANRFEFWQGRRNRVHDRILYRHITGGPWRIERLSP